MLPRFFSSYQRVTTGWNYVMGNFAQQSLPLSDFVVLTIQRINNTIPETVVVCSLFSLNFNKNFLTCVSSKLPYRARIGAATVAFTDTASWRANNCVAVNGTNGIDVYATSSAPRNSGNLNPFSKFQQQPPVSPQVARNQPLNVILDTAPPSDVVLPPVLQPSLPAVNGSRSVSQFYMLKDGKTGVMALGSFSDSDFNTFLLGMLNGLVSLKSLGATQLIVDMVSPLQNHIVVAFLITAMIVK